MQHMLQVRGHVRGAAGHVPQREPRHTTRAQELPLVGSELSPTGKTGCRDLYLRGSLFTSSGVNHLAEAL